MKILYPIKKGSVTQTFGQNSAFYAQRFGITGHNGIDIVSYHGDEILCPEDSVVVRVYGNGQGSVSAGFGLWLLGKPDANNVCNLWILWHTMSNICVKERQEVKQGDVIAYEGASGQVYVNGQPVPDSQKGVPPYPGTHLHWGNIKFQQVANTYKIVLTDLAGSKFQYNGNYFEWLNIDNGMTGCVDPMANDIIYYEDWLKLKVVQTVANTIPVVQTLPEAQQVSILQKIIDLLKSFLKRSQGSN